MKKLKFILVNLMFILSASVITLFIVDLCNSHMEFWSNGITKGMAVALSAVCVSYAAICAFSDSD